MEYKICKIDESENTKEQASQIFLKCSKLFIKKHFFVIQYKLYPYGYKYFLNDGE